MQCGLSPYAAWLEGRCCARAQDVDRRLDVSRRRLGRATSRVCQHHATAEIQRRSLRQTRGGNRPSDRLESQRRFALGLQQRALGRDQAAGDNGAQLWAGNAFALAKRSEGTLADDGCLGLGWRGVFADRRAGESVRFVPSLGQGREDGRGANHRGLPRDRLRYSRWPSRRCADGIGQHRVRNCGQLLRHLGA